MPKRIVDIPCQEARVKEKPADYPICLYMDCSKRERCLHALETTAERLECTIVMCVNPRICSDEAGCREFRDMDARVYFAFGMRGIAEAMKKRGLYKAFMNGCMHHFCRTVYYDMVAGLRSVSPREQQVILTIAAGLGVQLDADSFDRMVETVAW